MSPEHSEGNWTLHGGHQGKSPSLRGADPCNCESFPPSKGEVAPAKGNLTALLGLKGQLLEPGILLSKDQGVLIYTRAVMGPEKSTNRLARGKGGAV